MTTPPRLAVLGAVLAALAAALAIGGPAAAQWTICNESSFVAEVAVAYPEAERRVTEGWTRVRPGECQIARRAALTPGPHFIYARSSSAHRGGLREWSGTTPLCVDAGDFTLAGDAACEDVGFETRFFLDVPVESATKRTALVDPSFRKVNLGGPEKAANLARLRVAGIQRLLIDTGYYDRAIDGYTGRRTRRAIERFVADRGLSRTPQDFELIDLLEEAALRRQDEAGLKLCNRADTLVWSAIAMRSEDGWESRGWWPLGPDECAKVLDEPLNQPAYYVYASLSEPGAQDDRPLLAADEPFCLAPTRFAILGRESCAGRGYEEGRFATVLARERPFVTLEFSNSDFAAPTASLAP